MENINIIRGTMKRYQRQFKEKNSKEKNSIDDIFKYHGFLGSPYFVTYKKRNLIIVIEYNALLRDFEVTKQMSLKNLPSKLEKVDRDTYVFLKKFINRLDFD